MGLGGERQRITTRVHQRREPEQRQHGRQPLLHPVGRAAPGCLDELPLHRAPDQRQRPNQRLGPGRVGGLDAEPAHHGARLDRAPVLRQQRVPESGASHEPDDLRTRLLEVHHAEQQRGTAHLQSRCGVRRRRLRARAEPAVHPAGRPGPAVAQRCGDRHQCDQRRTGAQPHPERLDGLCDAALVGHRHRVPQHPRNRARFRGLRHQQRAVGRLLRPVQ